MNRVVITGMGWITPMGHSIEQVWPRLLKGESGISRTSIFDASTFPTSISAEVKDFRLAEHVESTELHSGAGRNTQFALAACKQACEGDNRCRAWSFARPGYGGPTARCYLKDKITPPKRRPCCMSGVVR